jgi:hypothetical protein
MDTLKDWAPVLVLLAGIFGAWWTVKDTAEDAAEGVKTVVESVQKTRSIHESDISKINSYVELEQRKQVAEEMNQRSLCADKTFSRIYCQSQGFPFGSN